MKVGGSRDKMDQRTPQLTLAWAWLLELSKNLREVSHCLEIAPTGAFSLLKAHNSAFMSIYQVNCQVPI